MLWASGRFEDKARGHIALWILMASIVGFAYHARPEADDWRQSITAWPAKSQSASARLEELGLGPRDDLGKGLSTRGKVLVVYGGQCGGCSANALDVRPEALKGYDQVWLLYSNGLSGQPVETGPVPENVRVVTASESKLNRSLAPLWVGKVMVFQDGSPVPAPLGH
jgi:hypothetical protein